MNEQNASWLFASLPFDDLLSCHMFDPSLSDQEQLIHCGQRVIECVSHVLPNSRWCTPASGQMSYDLGWSSLLESNWCRNTGHSIMSRLCLRFQSKWSVAQTDISSENSFLRDWGTEGPAGTQDPSVASLFHGFNHVTVSSPYFSGHLLVAKATKKCTESGEWFRQEGKSTGWTNYSDCKPNLDQEIDDESKQFEVSVSSTHSTA